MLHHIENHIENMRKKPEHKKKQYALLVSGSITLVIFGFWVAGKRPSNETFAAKPLPPVKALSASASDAFDYVKTFFTTGNKAKYGEGNVEVVPGKN